MQPLVACAWCSRVRLDTWVEPEVAIDQLRTYTWPTPPVFSHGVCDECLARLLQQRDGARVEAAAVTAPSHQSAPVRLDDRLEA